MNMMKKLALTSLTVAAGFLLVACSISTASQKKNDTWKTAEKTKTITIGFDNTFVPMGFKAKDNTNQGFDIDLANAV